MIEDDCVIEDIKGFEQSPTSNFEELNKVIGKRKIIEDIHNGEIDRIDNFEFEVITGIKIRDEDNALFIPGKQKQNIPCNVEKIKEECDYFEIESKNISTDAENSDQVGIIILNTVIDNTQVYLRLSNFHDEEYIIDNFNKLRKHSFDHVRVKKNGYELKSRLVPKLKFIPAILLASSIILIGIALAFNIQFILLSLFGLILTSNSVLLNNVYFTRVDIHNERVIEEDIMVERMKKVYDSNIPQKPREEIKFLTVNIEKMKDGSIKIKNDKEDITWIINGENGIPNTDIRQYSGIPNKLTPITTIKTVEKRQIVNGIESECGNWIIPEEEYEP